MGSLYVLEQGAVVHRHHERLVVRSQQARLTEIPLVHVDQVVLFGGTHLTTSAAGLLLDRDVPVAMCSVGGRLRGFLQPAYDQWVAARYEQVRRSDEPEFCLEVARAVVAAKLRNSRSYLRRLDREGRADASGAADTIGSDLVACAAAPTVDVLRGVEGAGAARYFRVLRAAFREVELGPRGWRAPDPAGALLNLSYGLLRVDVLRAVQLAGLDPFVGFYHRPRIGRVNLVLDLMEEWRPVLADAIALSAIRRRVIGAADFEPTEGGWLHLNNKALRKYLAEYHRRCETEVTIDGRSRSYREWLDAQARLFARSLRSGAEPYRGFVVP
jgi:CRISPR-associated protein Cas1